MLVGHDILMATMLNGAAVMDGALLLIAANETCPQPQTSEHLAAVEIMRLEHIIILQNKIDLIRCDKKIALWASGCLGSHSQLIGALSSARGQEAEAVL